MNTQEGKESNPRKVKLVRSKTDKYDYNLWINGHYIGLYSPIVNMLIIDNRNITVSVLVDDNQQPEIMKLYQGSDTLTYDFEQRKEV